MWFHEYSSSSSTRAIFGELSLPESTIQRCCERVIAQYEDCFTVVQESKSDIPIKWHAECTGVIILLKIRNVFIELVNMRSRQPLTSLIGACSRQMDLEWLVPSTVQSRFCMDFTDRRVRVWRSSIEPFVPIRVMECAGIGMQEKRTRMSFKTAHWRLHDKLMRF